MAKIINIVAKSDTPDASFYRLSLWKKGLIENGVDVKLYFLINSRIKNKILRYVLFVFNIIKVIIKCKSTVWIYGHPYKYLPWFFKSKKLLIERTEYPRHLIDIKNVKKQNISFYKNASLFITCSNALKRYYKEYTKKECLFYVAPLLVDTSAFENIDNKRPITGRYIAYCGSMGNNKDGVHDLLQAFSIVKRNIKNSYKLCLIGTASKEVMDSLRIMSDNLNISDDIIFTGLLKHEEVPLYLYNSELLVLSRPNNKQAEGGFPSKLGEYLSTGKPVLVTAVGEIPEYIKDGVNGYIVEPDKPTVFAEKMIYIFNNYDEATRIGLKGQQLAKQEFDYKRVTKNFNTFLEKNYD